MVFIVSVWMMGWNGGNFEQTNDQSPCNDTSLSQNGIPQSGQVPDAEYHISSKPCCCAVLFQHQHVYKPIHDPNRQLA